MFFGIIHGWIDWKVILFLFTFSYKKPPASNSFQKPLVFWKLFSKTYFSQILKLFVSVNKNVFALEESELFFSSSNDAFSEYVLNLRYNSDQVVISDVISSGMHNASIEKNENGELNIVVKKNTSGSEIGGIKIVYKTLVDGEVNIEVLKFAFKNKNYNIELMPALESIVLTSEFNYDFNVFVSLVNNVDKDNLLSDLSDFSLVLKEMNKFNRDKVTDEAVLDKLAYVDSCIEMYEDILNSLQAVKEDSSVVGALLGGR